jgi:tRNA nucleotidyltransferase (CCA-adding enzyme)
MHMPGAGADGAIVAWHRLAAQRWPIPLEAFPPGTALVGGAVRDALLNRLGPTPDLDLVVPGDAIAVCRELRRSHGGSAVVLDAERSIARLVVQGWSLDLARQEGDDLSADLHRRDYTINAMALPLAEPRTLVDPLGGAAHLAAGELVAVAEVNLLDDPLRLLRGLRLASELEFRLEPRTRTWILQHGPRIGSVAGERVLAELEKLAAAPAGHRGLADVLNSELLRPWQGAGSNEERRNALALLDRLSLEQSRQLQLSAEEAAAALPLARLAALLDGAALQALRSSRRLQQRVERLRHWQTRLGITDPIGRAAALPEAERLQLHRQLEEDLPALLLGWPEPEQEAAQATAERAEAAGWLERWRNPRDPLFHPRAAIDGGSLQRELQLRPSPQLGALLDHLMLEQAFGRLHERGEVLQRARQWLDAEANDGGMAPCRD